jgi:uncharacterized protein (TIRG00374 family)
VKSSILRLLEMVLFFAFAGGFLFFVPLQKIVSAIRGASPIYFWMACLLGLPVAYLSVLRLHMLLARQLISISVLDLLKIEFSVKFYSFFSPVSTVGSFMRWYKLSGEGKSAEVLTAITVNRLFDIFISITFGLFWIFNGVNGRSFVQPGLFLVYLFSMVLAWFVLTHYAPDFMNRGASKLVDAPNRWSKKSGVFIKNLSASLRTYSFFSLRELVFLFGAGIFGELISLLAYVSLASALNLPVSFINLGWMKAIFFLVSLAPFTLAGGMGLREVSVVLVLSAFGVSAELAAAFSILLYARSAVLGILGGAIELISILRRVPSQIT